MQFLKCDEAIIPMSADIVIDISKLESDLVVDVQTHHGVFRATGINAIEIIMVTRPGALEGRRLRWATGVWILHNLVGHPVMQMFACFGFPKTGMLYHEITVPKPKNFPK